MAVTIADSMIYFQNTRSKIQNIKHRICSFRQKLKITINNKKHNNFNDEKQPKI